MKQILTTFVFMVFWFVVNAQLAVTYKKPEQLNDGLQTGTLKEVGLNEKIIQSMVDSIVNGNYPNIHSVLIYRNNKLVYENYFPGRVQKR